LDRDVDADVEADVDVDVVDRDTTKMEPTVNRTTAKTPPITQTARDEPLASPVVPVGRLGYTGGGPSAHPCWVGGRFGGWGGGAEGIRCWPPTLVEGALAHCVGAASEYDGGAGTFGTMDVSAARAASANAVAD
jgi:hypothetical protein